MTNRDIRHYRVLWLGVTITLFGLSAALFAWGLS